MQKLYQMISLFSLGNDNREKHPAGEHDYPFSFELPNKLPSSFEGDHGYIRYQLKVKIKKSWKSDLKMKRMFSINQCIDVNEPKFNVGPGDEDQKTLGKCFSIYRILGYLISEIHIAIQ